MPKNSIPQLPPFFKPTNEQKRETQEQIIEIFLADLAARRGEVSAEVVSAVALDAKLEEEVKKAVSSVAGSDKISLSMRVDDSLIGGLVVRIGSRMIDTSIKTKLNRLEMTMKGVG